MDCAFHTNEGAFVLRVGGVTIRDGRLLAIREDALSSYYLPGGKVRLHETMEEALRREIWEELGAQARVVRPLWFCERSFSHKGQRIHELSAYFLTELEWDGLPACPQSFVREDADGQAQRFVWLSPDEVKAATLFPAVLQRSFPALPERLTLDTDMERQDAPTVDCKFLTEEGRFNYRVAGIFVHNGRLLAMKEDNIDHYYLPGGRVRLHESTEEALRREIEEELYVGAKPLRSLWLSEAFFELDGQEIHEIALYWLAELEWYKLPSLTEGFALTDTDGVPHHFTWLEPEQVRTFKIYPLALKASFPVLPDDLVLDTDTRQRG